MKLTICPVFPDARVMFVLVVFIRKLSYKSIRLSQFLMGLSEQYTAIKGQLLLMNPQPTLSRAYSLLLQEETQRETTI